jgi:hypothetical protein
MLRFKSKLENNYAENENGRDSALLKNLVLTDWPGI